MRSFPLPVFALAAALFLAPALHAQADATYRTPSAALAAIVEAPLTPLVSLSPDKKTILLLERPALPPVAELAAPELRLAGLRINPATNGPSRDTYYTGFVAKTLAGGAERRVTGFPAGARLNSFAWSRDSRHLLVTVTHANSVQLWLADLANATARRLTQRALNGVIDEPTWVDDTTIVASFIPAGRGAEPVAPTVPAGPVVQENLSGKRPARTYPDMLANAYDEALFERKSSGRSR